MDVVCLRFWLGTRNWHLRIPSNITRAGTVCSGQHLLNMKIIWLHISHSSRQFFIFYFIFNGCASPFPYRRGSVPPHSLVRCRIFASFDTYPARIRSRVGYICIVGPHLLNIVIFKEKKKKATSFILLMNLSTVKVTTQTICQEWGYVGSGSIRSISPSI